MLLTAVARISKFGLKVQRAAYFGLLQLSAGSTNKVPQIFNLKLDFKQRNCNGSLDGVILSGSFSP